MAGLKNQKLRNFLSASVVYKRETLKMLESVNAASKRLIGRIDKRLQKLGN